MRERLGRDDQLGGVTPVTLEHGVRAARLRSFGGLDALVILDRAMDIAQCSYRGIPLVWHGPGMILPPDPGVLNLDQFNRRFFAGLLTTCGLEAFGPPGKDKDGEWGQHGHINECAAEDVQMQFDVESADEFVILRGRIRQAALFHESLILERTWTMSRDGGLLRLHDRVTNEGGEKQPHMMLYHCNFGYPMLDESTRISVSATSMRPRDDASKPGLAVWNQGGPPQAGFHEQVFIHQAKAEDAGWAVGRIENAKLGVAAEVRFHPEQLPACVTWRMLGMRWYVMAIEPANCETIEGRIAARERGTLPFIGAGETRDYELEFRFMTI